MATRTHGKCRLYIRQTVLKRLEIVTISKDTWQRSLTFTSDALTGVGPGFHFVSLNKLQIGYYYLGHIQKRSIPRFRYSVRCVYLVNDD